MPFALIAVTLLLLSSVASVVMVEHSRSEGGVNEINDGMNSIATSLDDVQSYVNQELGVIILEISKDDELGTLDERASVFEERAYKWIDDRFPMKSGNVIIRLNDRSLDLTAVPMEILSDDAVVGGYTPSYLHGKGSLDVTASSDYGRTSKEIVISTDGSYALPLSSEQGSLFERMVENGGISISQMMTYELQSLAQYRVLNGYGAKSQYGQRGLDSIITREDVKDAYDNALSLVRTLCFRDPDGRIVGNNVDLADMMVEDNVYIDLSAFYGQILLSVIDDMGLKWYDYLCGNKLLKHYEDMYRPYKIAIDSLMRFVSGEDPFSAEGYIVKVMEKSGVDSSVYRTPGSGMTTVTVNGYTVTVDNPVIDIMNENWISMFNIHYSAGNSYIEDNIKRVLNTAAENMFEGSGTMIIEMGDDQSSFFNKVAEALKSSSYEIRNSLESSLLSAINKEKCYDPFYSEIADVVMKHADRVAQTDELRFRIESALIDALSNDIDDYEEYLAAPEIEDAIHRYKSAVYSDLSVYEDLRHIEGGSGTNLIYDAMKEILTYGLDLLDISELIEGRAEIVINEILSNMEMNPYSGHIDLPNTDYFLLVDESGNRTKEFLDLTYTHDPIISEPRVLTKKCTHVTGFRENMSAAYSTTFSIHIEDVLDYRIEGSGSLSSVMGGSYTSASSGTVRNNITIEISVASAWALQGVKYSASETILDDSFQALLKYLEPMMEPLREIMAIVMDVVDMLNRCVMEIAHYVTETLTRMMDNLMRPMETIATWVEAQIEQYLEDNMMDLYLSLNLNEQKIGFEYMGYTFELKMDVASLYASTKTLFVATLSGPLADMDVVVSAAMKCKGEVNAGNLYVIGKAQVKSEDWDVKLTMDPLMKGSKHLISISADIYGVDVSAVLPELEDYNELGVTLSKIPGIGEALSNIPIPGLGVNVGLDAGLSIKYTAPTATGLIINEFESNPAGSDKNNEWIELLNNTSQAIDLAGYTLIASSDRSTKKMVLSGTIAPGEFLVIKPTFSMVNNSGKLTKNGEGLTLKDPEGVVIDKTGVRKDNADDSKTWQRSYDGSSQWEFKEDTMGKTNGSYISSKLLTVEIAKEIMLDSVHDAFEKVDAITDTESLQKLMQEIVKSAINTIIKKVAGCLVEASVFIKVDIKDITSTTSSGIRIALRCDSDLVEDVLKYIAGNLEAMAMNIKNPYRIDCVSMFTDNIDLEITFDTKVQYPAILARSLEEVPQVGMGITFRTNISALTQLLGEHTGKPGVECGVRILDCPMAIIPGKLSPKNGMTHDMWLIKMNIEWK